MSMAAQVRVLSGSCSGFRGLLLSRHNRYGNVEENGLEPEQCHSPEGRGAIRK